MALPQLVAEKAPTAIERNQSRGDL